MQCELISNYLREMAEEKKVPVYAFVEDAGRKFHRHFGIAYNSDNMQLSLISTVKSCTGLHKEFWVHF